MINSNVLPVWVETYQGENMKMINQPSDFEFFFKKMGHRFTSHEFIFRLAHEHQKEYVRALTLHLENSSLFKELHHELFRRLRKLEGHILIAHSREYPSRNIFGMPACVTLWQKK